MSFEAKYNKLKKGVKTLKTDNMAVYDENQALNIRINELIRENEQLKMCKRSFTTHSKT